MNLISVIPYKDKLYNSKGAFINQNGEFIFTNEGHESFASDFCKGKDYQFLSSLSDNHFEEGKDKKYDIDPYKSSKLTKEQLELYKLWLNERLTNYKSYLKLGKECSDFLVYLLGFDKVETVMRRAITTTSPTPHIRFYNYYLMDWYIDHQSPMKYNKDTGYFEYDEREDCFFKFKEDRKVESEINEIKSKVLLKDRHLFFK